MKRYVVEMTDELAVIYQDVAKMNHKTVEECLAIILERVIRTMVNQPHTDKGGKDGAKQEKFGGDPSRWG